MKMEMFSAYRLFFCFIDIYMLYRFLNAMFSVYRVSKKRTVYFCAMATVAIFLINAQASTLFNLMLVPICCLVFSAAVFQTSLGNNIIYTLVFYTVFVGAREVAFELLRRIISMYIPFFAASWHNRNGGWFLLFEYGVSLLFLLYMERFIKKVEISEDVGISTSLLILPAASMMISGSFLYMEFPDSRVIQNLMCAGAFLLYFSNVAIFIMLTNFAALMKREKADTLYYVKQVDGGGDYQELMELNKKYREYIHDINRCFRSIRVLAKGNQHQDIIEVVNGLDTQLQEGEIHAYCNGRVMNAMLSSCKERASKEGVELSVWVDDRISLKFMPPLDQISIYGNLLDNACEAAAQCKEGERTVSVRLYMANTFLLVCDIENSFANRRFRIKNRYLSTKRKERGIVTHGLGLGIVKRRSEKYAGILEIAEREGIFAVNLTVSNNLKLNKSGN